MRAIFGGAILALGLFAGCRPMLTALTIPSVKGSGTVKEETREVGDFTGVAVSSSLHADVSVGEKPSLRVSAEDNILPLIETEVRNGRLYVGLKPTSSVSATKPMSVTITAPGINFVSASGASEVGAKVQATDSFALDASGASHVSVSGLDTKKLDAGASGASQVKLSGKAETVKAGLSGACTLEASELAAETVRADFSGASRGTVQATKSLTGELSGASTLSAAGNPAKRAVGTSGASSVNYR